MIGGVTTLRAVISFELGESSLFLPLRCPPVEMVFIPTAVIAKPLPTLPPVDQIRNQLPTLDQLATSQTSPFASAL